MQKYVLMFDDCLKLDAARIMQITSQFADAMSCPDTPIVTLPPGVSVLSIEAETRKPKVEEKAKGHAK